NRLSIITYKVLIDIGVDIYFIVSNIFAEKLNCLYFESCNDFELGYVIPYRKAKPDIIN
ncbi:hypothetical protein QR685DRAFT_443408, partial [Neurospora intermedia]